MGTKMPGHLEGPTVAAGWRHSFSHFIRLMGPEGREALLAGLESDDSRLIQGATTMPPPMMCVQDWDVEAADFIAYAGWIGHGRGTVGEAEEYFARLCFNVDQAMGEPAGCRWAINWWDETPRGEAFREAAAMIRGFTGAAS